MEIAVTSHFSDPLPLAEKSESSLSSDAGNVNRREEHSDDEVMMLASRIPKKRAGRKIFRETRHPVYRGVRRRNGNKWVCELREPNKKTRIWLGTYPTPDMAARAHDVAALALRGKSACLNFADSAWLLPRPTSTSAKDIRLAAAQAVEMVQKEECGQGYGGDGRMEEEVDGAERPAPYVDEEAVFAMPSLLQNMAEGLLLSPPSHWIGDDVGRDELETYVDMSLWSFSI